jgi:hypothetical protein
LGTAQGSFAATGQEVAVDANPQDLVLADLDGDGDLDLATADAGGSSVSIRFNQNQPAASGSTAHTSALALAAAAPGAPAATPASPLYPLVDGTLFPQFLAAGLRAEAELGVAPAEFSAYPNPVARTATVRFAAAQAGWVQVRLYNTLGQLVATLYDGHLAAGQLLERPLDATNLAAGIYSCRLSGAAPARSFQLVVNP